MMPAIPALTLWHPGTPRAKGRPRTETTWLPRGGKLKPVTRTVTPSSTRDEEELIGWEWRTKHRGDPSKRAVAVTIVAVGGTADADNVTKLVLDALNGVAYWDDQQVAHLRVWKLPNDCGAPVGTWISVRPLPRGWAARVARWLVKQLASGGTQ